MPNKLELLEQIRTDILSQDVCPDLAKTALNLVMGDGNVDADIVFIGEAPGKQEDEQGLPFVGASGRFLNEMLDVAGLVRSDVYITNIVKYRPPNNRDPLPDEKKAFWPYLVRQLAVIEPKVIVTLGRHSMEYFLPDARISQIHGHIVKLKVIFPNSEQGKVEREVTLLPLYHPAAALYNGSLRQTLLDDFAHVQSCL